MNLSTAEIEAEIDSRAGVVLASECLGNRIICFMKDFSRTRTKSLRELLQVSVS